MTMLFLRCSKSLDRQLEELNRADRKARHAVRQCQEILANIRSKGLTDRFFINKRTKCGEARLENCVKYDLGNGYRMITIRWKNHLFIPFVGTHDKADLWLENNRLQDCRKNQSAYTFEKLECDHGSCDPSQSRGCLEEHDEYEKSLLERIDDKILRQVFNGLVNQPVMNEWVNDADQSCQEGAV